MRLAARRRTDEICEDASALDAMAEAIASGADSSDADARFHAAIAAASRNELLVGPAAARGADRADRRASLSLPDWPPRSLTAHRRVLAAIEAGDEEGAAQAMGDHLRVVGEVALAPRRGSEPGPAAR